MCWIYNVVGKYPFKRCLVGSERCRGQTENFKVISDFFFQFVNQRSVGCCGGMMRLVNNQKKPLFPQVVGIDPAKQRFLSCLTAKAVFACDQHIIILMNISGSVVSGLSRNDAILNRQSV